MSDRPEPSPTLDGDALLAQADAIHDDEPQRALELLRALDVATVSANRLQRLSFLLDHVFGEKFDLWAEALDGQRIVVQQAGALATPGIFRHAAIAAQVAGDAALARLWTQALAASSDAPLAKARALVSLGAVGFSVSRLGAESAGRMTLQALQPLAALHASPGGGLDAAFGAVTNNLASDLLEGRGTPSRGLDIAAEYIAAHEQAASAKAAVSSLTTAPTLGADPNACMVKVQASVDREVDSLITTATVR